MSIQQSTIDRSMKLRLGQFTVDPTADTVSGPVGVVNLEPKVMDLLLVLCDAEGEVVTRQELISRVWQAESGGDDSLTRAISILRKALQDERGARRMIETIPRRGYRLLAPVSQTTGDPGLSNNIIVPIRRNFLRSVSVAGAAVILVIALLVWVSMQRSPPENLVRGSVEVLAWDVIGEDALAMETARSGEVALVRALIDMEVPTFARTSRLAPQGAAGEEDTQSAEFMLLGFLRQNAGGFVAEMQLVDTTSGDISWSYEWEQEEMQADSLIREVARGTATTVQCGLNNKSRRGSSMPVETFRLWLKYCAPDREGPSGALALAEKLVRSAPDDPRAYSSLAWSIWQTRGGFSDADRQEKLQQIAAAAERALELDAHDRLAQFVLTLLLPIEEWSAALSAMQQTASVSREFALGRAGAGLFLASSGRLQESLPHFEMASSVRPLPIGETNLAAHFALVGRVREAVETIEKAYRLWPDSPMVIQERFAITLFYGDTRDAARLLDEPRTSAYVAEWGGVACWQTFVQARRKDRDAIAAFTPELCNGASDLLMTRAYATLGNIEQALRFAKARISWSVAVDDRLSVALLFYPEMKPVQADPRFLSLVAWTGLLEYWLEENIWPDFCNDPDLPYDCRVAAAATVR
jgi:DNA-binding winged helix-turn-helix (wHTH) protein/Flp pilus assembly protein TadD